MMHSDIILIGPSRVGKSTVGKLLAARLEQSFVDLSKIASQYYPEQSYDWAEAKRAWDEGGFAGFLHYQAPFNAYVVEQGLLQHSSSVIELDAFQVAFTDDTLFERVRRAMQPYRMVVLLLPATDTDVSVHVLDQRGRVLYDELELNEHFIRHHSNHDLAKIRIYTKGKTPQETCEAIERQLDPASPEVFLIGPIGAGKSTLGKMLAQRLGRPQIALDDIRWDYYKEIGYDETVQQEINEQEGFVGVYRYWKPFEVHAVVRAIQDHHDCVMDFGAGHSVHENDADFARIQALLAAYPNVIMILPSPDLDESVAILEERNTPKIDEVSLTRYLVTHQAFRTLATHVVYTQDKTPEEISEEIVRLADDAP